MSCRRKSVNVIALGLSTGTRSPSKTVFGSIRAYFSLKSDTVSEYACTSQLRRPSDRSRTCAFKTAILITAIDILAPVAPSPNFAQLPRKLDGERQLTHSG